MFIPQELIPGRGQIGKQRITGQHRVIIELCALSNGALERLMILKDGQTISIKKNKRVGGSGNDNHIYGKA